MRRLDDPDENYIVLRHLRFSLRTLLLIVVVAAVGLTAWRQWAIDSELKALRSKTDWLEREQSFQSKINEARRLLNIENPKHRCAYEAFESMPMLFTEVAKESVKGRDTANLSVLLFHRPGWEIPGVQSTVALLVCDRKLVDVVAETTSTRDGIQKVRLEDVDHDGALDLVLEFNPDMPVRVRQDSSVEVPQPYTKAFSMSRSGFTEVSRP